MTDDPRIAYGYDPDAYGSYHPDPEDYPPAPDVDADPADRPVSGRSRRSAAPAASRLQRQPNVADTPSAATFPGPADAEPPWHRLPHDAFPAPDKLPSQNPSAPTARRLTDSGVFAAFIAGILGLAAILILAYGVTKQDRPGQQSSVVTPTAPAGRDTQPDPQPPADTAPTDAVPTIDPQVSSTPATPASGGDNNDARQPDDGEDDGGEDDGGEDDGGEDDGGQHVSQDQPRI